MRSAGSYLILGRDEPVSGAHVSVPEPCVEDEHGSTTVAMSRLVCVEPNDGFQVHGARDHAEYRVVAVSSRVGHHC